ncbi:hypothetical protein L1049_005798 [Liquidambar formosana]|uniref:Histidine kinase/HSP90-like ATPase domain-containing protein n=1 Tax=Liquidambar formosana TaxID=63359 RepID=A0AAP0RE97_LIQFO
MMVSAITSQTSLCNFNCCNILFCPNNHKLHTSCRPNPSLPKTLLLTNASSSSLANNTSLQNQNPNPNTLRHVTHTSSDDDGDDPDGGMVPSASAVASAIRRASTSPVEFMQRIEKDQKNNLVLPSPDFQRLCLEQLHLFRRIVDPHALLSKAMLLQQSSWQNNVRMSTLVEQIRGPLSSIRTLSKMLSIHLKRSEISHDIVEDILVQGDRMRDTLQQLQDAVYLTKANIVRYNEEALEKMHNSAYSHPESVRSQLSNSISMESSSNMMQNSSELHSLASSTKDLEMPMPPLALAPLQQDGIRPCNVSDVLADLVGAVEPLAHKQQRAVELRELSQPLQVAVEEPALRQALSNLIEGALLRTHVGGKVEIVSTGAPAGGALVVIDDDGPDMHYMTQTHSLTPFGADLFSRDMVEDNMTWNFVAGLTVAREILESYGCVVRVVSPRIRDAALGAGGTRVELWLPSYTALSDRSDPALEL